MKRFAFLFAIFVCLFAAFAGSISAQILEDLRQQISSGDSENKREALYQIRIWQTAEAARIAIPALTDVDEIVRATATNSVVFLPSLEAAQYLLPLLNDKSAFVRRETAFALGKTKNQIAIDPLLLHLQKDKELEVKTAIVSALGELGNPISIEPLLKILQRKPKELEEFFRRTAARSLGQIAQIQQFNNNYVVTPESFLPDQYDNFAKLRFTNLAETNAGFQQSSNILINILKNPKDFDDVKREAAFAIGSIGDISAIENLRQNLSAKDYYLAEICREAIAKISRKD